MSHRKLAFVIALTALAATLAVMWRSMNQKQPSPRAESPQEAAQVQQRVSAVESELATMRALVARAPSAPGLSVSAQPNSAEAAAPTTSAAETPKLTPEEHDRQMIEGTLTSLEATLASEARDLAWERQSAKALAVAFANPELATSHVGAVDCVRTVCKVVVQHQDERARSDFMEAGHHMLSPFNAPAFIHYSPTTKETIVYVAREGEELPIIPPTG